MKAVPKAWLPPGAMSDGALCMLLTERIVTWSRRWFGATENVAVRLQKGAEAAKISLGATCWESKCGSLCLAIERPKELRIAAAMLGLKHVGSKLGDPDMRLLRELAAACLTDVLRSAGEVFGVRHEIRHAPDRSLDELGACGLWYNISLSTGRSFDIYVRHDAAIAARKALTLPLRAPSPLGTREEAIDRQIVRVGAHVGSGKVGLAELTSLARGDVLVLDSAFGHKLDLTVNGAIQPDAGCELQQDGPVFRLRVTPIEDGVVS